MATREELEKTLRHFDAIILTAQQQLASPAHQTQDDLRRMIQATAEPKGFYETTAGNTLPGLVGRAGARLIHGSD